MRTIRRIKPLTSKEKEKEGNSLRSPRLQDLRSVPTARNITLLHVAKATPGMSVTNSRRTTLRRKKTKLLTQLRSERKRYPNQSVPLPPSKPHKEPLTHTTG